MSQPRNTRNSQRAPIDTLPTLRSATPAQGSSSNPRQRSPSGSADDVPNPIVPTIPEGDEGDVQIFNPEPDPEENQADLNRDENAPPPEISLARSLELLANRIATIPGESRPKTSVKPRVPDVFDGSDPSKLDTFTFQCSMYILACKREFPDQESRVTFVLSYLKGNPLDWFQNELSDAINNGGEYPTWFTDYPEFVAELQRLFGPRDPVADATNAIESLKYKDSTKATRYTLDFNRHARRTGWNEQALTRQYYKGLPDRIKDEIARIGKPSELQSLQDLVSTLDQRYWERQSEISRDKRSANQTSKPQSSDNRSDHRSDNRSDHRSNDKHASGSKPTNNNNSNNQQHKNKDHSKPASSSQSSAQPNRSNTISDLLGPDGKLKPEERQRRMDKNLCLRCAKPGHLVSACPLTNKAKPKGRAANVSTASGTASPSGNPSASGKV